MSTDLGSVHNAQGTSQTADIYGRSAGSSFSYGHFPSPSLAVASSSAWRATPGLLNPRPVSVKKAVNVKRTPEELDAMKETASRLSSRLAEDQASISQADIDSPFVDELDAVNRLLPYHVYQQPRKDLEQLVPTARKGKGKAVDEDLASEIYDTKVALEFHKRRSAIYDRWRKLKREATDDQAYYLAQVILDADRSENAWLANELRTARTEAERIEREKRAANASRVTHFSSTSQPVMPTYGAAIHQPTVTTFPASPAAASYVPYQPTAAIPVQLPVTSLPALHSLGIIPVPAASIPPEGQPPAAVLRGSTANGSILSLEINVSLLQGSQMSGLAMVLNSLVARGNAPSVTTTNATANTPVQPQAFDPAPNSSNTT
ncbi:hypothetical protein NLJ89_g7953 [Agrocybe chaxingu]|uniref:GLTSCR protein conserved domain-containing protein n=1 Tax=Agrocybe chaxingu TaxID=84603 RepID=A0A9W8JW65_9AGAR|nr:hypothetical protein NLJ89_g7953 [Agrocybe chaxingu]